MKKTKLSSLLPFLLCLMTLGGCAPLSTTGSEAGKAPTYTGSEPAPPNGGDVSETVRPPEVFDQILLFLQEGLRERGLMETYQVYISEPEAMEKTFYCEALLRKGGEYYSEEFYYTYDSEKDWYVFTGQYEPVLALDGWFQQENSEAVQNLLQSCIYTAELSAYTDIGAPVRYFSENGPVEKDDFKDVAYSSLDIVWPYLYTYQDERLQVNITIEYAQLALPDKALEETLNGMVRNAFFYSYGSDPAERLKPGEHMYTTITRNYQTVREDDRLVSLRIYESNCSRMANHPNAWETAVTVDLAAGRLLTLRDIVGEGMTPAQLLDSGAFHCLWTWEDAADSEESCQDWILSVKEEYEQWDYTLDSLNSDFYLTGDSLGLITHLGRYYTCIEAKLTDLGLEEWVKKDNPAP